MGKLSAVNDWVLGGLAFFIASGAFWGFWFALDSQFDLYSSLGWELWGNIMDWGTISLFVIGVICIVVGLMKTKSHR